MRSSKKQPEALPPGHARATLHIDKILTGRQCHLMRCIENENTNTWARDDENLECYYVVKWDYHPHRRRPSINDFFGSRLASEMLLPVPEVAPVHVSTGLTPRTDHQDCPRKHFLHYKPGLVFGSKYPGSPGSGMVFDSLTPPWDMLDVSNPSDFLGMLVFDLWTNNSDERQVIFVSDDAEGADANDDGEVERIRQGTFTALMIDQDECFGGETWSFMEFRQPFAPYRGVFDNVTTLDSFEPWLSQVVNAINIRVLYKIASQIPPEWMEQDFREFNEVLQFLDWRRKLLPELLYWLIRRNRDYFPRWKLALSTYTPAPHTAARKVGFGLSQDAPPIVSGCRAGYGSEPVPVLRRRTRIRVPRWRRVI
jgi:hypothetical protein